MQNTVINYVPIKEGDREFKPVSRYAQLLRSLEWQNRRKEILARDAHRCTDCKIGPTIQLWSRPVVGLETLGLSDAGRWVVEPIFSKEPVSLHVHHRLYVLERRPWNYPNDELVTLCDKCHLAEHERATIPVYLREIDLYVTKHPNIIVCPKCGGDGYLPHFNYYQAGVCFGCSGNCFVLLKENWAF